MICNCFIHIETEFLSCLSRCVLHSLKPLQIILATFLLVQSASSSTAASPCVRDGSTELNAAQGQPNRTGSGVKS